MGQPFVGEIRMFAGNFAPSGWMFCAGQLIAISENDTLFNLIGTTYGGDGATNFALPDLRGRLPLHQGNGFALGQNGGAEQVTLTLQQLATHSHPLQATSASASTTNPSGALLAKPSKNMYRPGPGANAMNSQSVGGTGGSQPHDNIQPYLCINFIISLFGIYPQQS